MSALLGLLVLHALGAGVAAIVERRRLNQTLQSPSSLFVSLLVLGCASLGWRGLVVAVVAALATWLAPRNVEERPVPRSFWAVIGALLAFVLARPWVPLYWDEFVWLAKARLSSVAFLGGVTEASLDPTAQVIPAGYVPLWPSAVGWLSLGTDALPTHTVAASLLVLACVAVALESWWPLLARAKGWALLSVLSAPLVLVHLRAVYVDLPVGLLGVALLGRLLEGRAGLSSIALAFALAGFKDEGVAHVVAASLAGVVFGPLRFRALGPLAVAIGLAATWRLAIASSGVNLVDHSLNAPALAWAPRLFELLALHATEPFSWGVSWVVTIVMLAWKPADVRARALKVALVANLGFLVTAVLFGPERVRVFAENGTLLNRLLLQSWPVAALLVIAQGSAVAPLSGRPVTDTKT